MPEELMGRGCCNLGNAESVRPVVSRPKATWCKRLEDLVWNSEAPDTKREREKKSSARQNHAKTYKGMIRKRE